MFGAYNKEDEFSYSLGSFPTVELIKNRPEDIISIALSSKLTPSDELALFLNKVKDKTVIDDKSIDRISKKGNVFVAAKFRKRYEKFSGASHVVLVKPSDAGNLGTIMRTMLGFGLRNLVIVGADAVDEYNPKTVRASMGAVFSLSIEKYDTFEEYEEAHSENKYLFMLGGDTPLSKVIPSEKYALIFGNEATGLPKNYNEKGTTVLIKHSDAIDSLNLPQAVGIALYEFTKSRFN